MKGVFTFVFLLTISVSLYADWGFWDANRSNLTIDFNGSQTGYSIWNSAAGTFHGANLGELTSSSQTLSIADWEVRTYKNSGSDVTNADMYYVLYKSGSRPATPTFTLINGGWLEELGSDNQRWGYDVSTSIDVSSLDASSTYNLEIYIVADGTTPNETKYDSNTGGTNYIAYFTTTGAVPVELTSFTANTIGTNTELNWTTATEVNNYGFEIESSNDNTNWTNIGFVEGHGNSNSVKEYSFTPLDNASYYRLKQIDTDGGFEYSDVLEVEIKLNFKLAQNHPNPFNPTTAISFTIPEVAKVSITVYNALGQAVAELANQEFGTGSHSVNFNASNLTSGIYFYRLESSQFSQTMKMILMK